MKDEILKLREEGKSYNEIMKILHCSKGTVSYYCGDNQKEKAIKRTQKRRKNILIVKLEHFKYRKNRALKEKVRRFNKTDSSVKIRVNKLIEPTFTVDDVINKFGMDTICYLSGERINLYEDTYQFDHISPSSKSNDNTFENLGITHTIVNKMKSDLSVDEFLMWCVKILKHNGYTVEK